MSSSFLSALAVSLSQWCEFLLCQLLVSLCHQSASVFNYFAHSSGTLGFGPPGSSRHDTAVLESAPIAETLAPLEGVSL